MKTTHEILIFKKQDRYDIFLDGVAILEDAEMTKNHIMASFQTEGPANIKDVVDSLKGVIEGLPEAKRTIIKKEINKLEKLLR